jgi:nucleoside-triphosphatase
MTEIEKNILVTGLQGSVKTTLLGKAAEALRVFRPAGFITSDVRKRGLRKGFELRGLNGQKGLLAHTDIISPFRVGKYRVDVAGCESFLKALPLSGPATGSPKIRNVRSSTY